VSVKVAPLRGPEDFAVVSPRWARAIPRAMVSPMPMPMPMPMPLPPGGAAGMLDAFETGEDAVYVARGDATPSSVPRTAAGPPSGSARSRTETRPSRVRPSARAAI
jgi:hypothetical protein